MGQRWWRGNRTLTRPRTVWLLTAAWVAGTCGYAVYRNGPAQYVAAAILAVGAVVVAASKSRRLSSRPARVPSRRQVDAEQRGPG